ncbi:MAG: DEAD/DEAH box helicase, partial [Lachnospiraceae bacterium]|nr:DEAD/DEAH box helicase [Lachnospiraceae bacterium]
MTMKTCLSFDLRPYQLEAVDKIRESWADWDHSLLVLPTGCGKTVVFNTIANEQPGRTLILAHRDELIEQARDKFAGMHGWMPGKIKASENDVKRVTVGSVQTMCRRQYDPDMFQTVIVDEAHHAVSDSYQAILRQFDDAKVLGVTATPDRGDKRSLASYFDGIAYEYSLKTAIREGYLSPITARTVPLEIDMSSVKVTLGDFEVGSVAEALKPYLSQIAEAIETYAADRKTVVFCPLISIAQELAQMIPGAKEVNGTSADRKEILEWFDQAGPGAVLCNAMLLTEGWDCPSCDCVVVLRPTKIRSLYCQMVGRGTRLSPGKENLLILDFIWLSTKHNLCKPASLVSENAEDIQHVTERSEHEEIELFEALSDAEEARRTALAQELAKQTNKTSKLINPLEIFSVLDDIGLADYEPTFKWEHDPATPKQMSGNRLHQSKC